MKRSATLLAATLGCAGLASCALQGLQGRAEPPPTARPVGIVQADDGRFLSCIDCERPTPKTAKTAGRQAAVSQRVPAAVAAALVPPRAAQAPAVAPEPPVSRRGAMRMLRTTVVFENDSARLSDQARQQLRRLLPLISQATGVRAVGFTDDTGSQPLNDELATARALAVMVEMRRQLGLANGGPTLAADGRGLCCYLNGNRDAAERARNRRVELQIRFEDTPAVDRLASAHADLLDETASRAATQRTGARASGGGADE
jgi:outer membrane protein OmpA-like peptidoglycan-associated protein